MKKPRILVKLDWLTILFILVSWHLRAFRVCYSAIVICHALRGERRVTNGTFKIHANKEFPDLGVSGVRKLSQRFTD